MLDPIKKERTPDKYLILSSHLYQMDLLTMPMYNKFNFVIVIINMRTRISDVQPIYSKSALHVLQGFEKIVNRKIIEKIEAIFLDNGAEFKNKYMDDYCKKEDIGLIWTNSNNHKQNAIVENANGTYKKFLNNYLSYMSLEKGKYYNNWVEKLFVVRDELNKYAKENYPKNVDLMGMAYEGSMKPKFKVGDDVYIKLDAPRSLIGNKRLHGTFRRGDIRFDNKNMYKVSNINYNQNNLRYTVEKNGKRRYGTLLENELLNAPNT